MPPEPLATLNARQRDILALLATHDDHPTGTGLATELETLGHTATSKSQMSRDLSGLVDRGFVERTMTLDGRENGHALSESGWVVLRDDAMWRVGQVRDE